MPSSRATWIWVSMSHTSTYNSCAWKTPFQKGKDGAESTCVDIRDEDSVGVRSRTTAPHLRPATPYG